MPAMEFSLTLVSKQNMSYVLEKLFHEGIGHIDLTDIGHAAIYVCLWYFHCCIIFLSPGPFHPGYYIRIVDFQGR